MRLIGVAAGIRQLCPTRDLVASHKADRVIEPQDAREQLWRHAGLASEAHGEVLPTPTEFPSQRGHPDASGTGLQPLQSPEQVLGKGADREAEPPRDPLLQEHKSAGVRIRSLQTLDGLSRRRAEKINRIDQSVADLIEPKAKQKTGTQRRQHDLRTFLGA